MNIFRCRAGAYAIFSIIDHAHRSMLGESATDAHPETLPRLQGSYIASVRPRFR